MRTKGLVLAGVVLLCGGCAGFLGGSSHAPGGLLFFRNSGVAGSARLHRVSTSGGSVTDVAGSATTFESSMAQNGDVYTTLDATGSVYKIVDGTAIRLNLSTDNFRPCVTPDGSRIVFVSTRDGNEEIYAMDGSGNGETNITTNAADDTFPAISRDGTKVVFTSGRDGNGEIYLENFNGTGLTRITNDAGDDTTPAFTEDGTHIIFSSNRSGVYQLYTVDLTGANLIQLTSSAGDKFHASYKVNGNAIFYYMIVSGTRQVFRCDADGSHPVQLTSGAIDADKEATWVY